MVAKSKVGLLFQEIKNVLSQDATLQAYVNNINSIYEGFREDLFADNQYLLMLELVEDREEVNSLPNFIKINVDIDIYCCMNQMDYDKQAVDIADFCRDVKNCLWGKIPDFINSQYLAMNNTANSFKLPRTSYLNWGLDKFSWKAGVVRIESVIYTTPQGR